MRESEGMRELTRVPPDEFVAARDALARKLRGEGRRDDAASVAKLRRPSPALWAVNALTEEAGPPLRELLEAGEAMREGTQAALRGRRADLGRLSSTHARKVEELTSRAMDVLTSSGRAASPDTRARIWTILRAASTDPETAPLLAEGTMLTEPSASGFEGMEGFALAPADARPEKAPARGRAAGDRDTRRREEREARRRDAEAAVEARAAEAREAREDLAAARERLEDIRARLARAERDERRLARAAEEAERAADAARRELDRLSSD